MDPLHDASSLLISLDPILHLLIDSLFRELVERATVFSNAGFFLIGIWVPLFLHRLRLLTFRVFFSKKIGPY